MNAFRPLAFIAACVLVALTTALAAAIRSLYALPDLEMLYFVAIVLSAIRLGRGPSILAAALSVIAYDFFFVPPYLTMAVDDVRYVLSFAMMFAVGLVVSELTTRLRTTEQKAHDVELQNALLSTVSHDLRTPLAAITGAATTLRDESSLPNETRTELLGSIVHEAGRMERLVTNLLEMTRIESGAVQLRREWVPAEEVIGSALTRLEDRLQDRRVNVQLPTELPLLHVDPVLFEQVLVNLFENEAKYTPKGTAIDVRANVDGESIVVEISDRGPGLAPGTEERIFEKFFRADGATGGGAGLGLTIARGIVKAHGGRITAANREGGGATFRVRLPRDRGAPKLDTPEPRP